MRNRLLYLIPIFHYLGALFWIFGFVFLIPFLVLIPYAKSGHEEVSYWSFLLPANISWFLGAVLREDGLRTASD
jgi:hypothetical protein